MASQAQVPDQVLRDPADVVPREYWQAGMNALQIAFASKVPTCLGYLHGFLRPGRAVVPVDLRVHGKC
jgi:hypothetical protein